MNVKNAFPWIFVLALAAVAGLLFTSSKNKETELAQLRQENAELPELRALAEAAKKASANQGEEMTPKEREELVRLRNEVGGLRREKQQLMTQVQQAQKTQANQKAQQADLLQQNQQLAQLTREQQVGQVKDACINNLRQIDGAKQQWALEAKQPADALVVPLQISRYFKNGTMLACPGGGVYNLNTVSTPPACSIPGHSLTP